MNNNNRRISGMFVLFMIWTIAVIIGFEISSCRMTSALSETKAVVTLAVTENTSNAVNEIVSAITEISNKIDTIIENETAILDTNATNSDLKNINVAVSKNTAQRFMIGEEVLLPVLSTEPKLFTDYRSYNLWYTPYYRLQQAAYTDEDGLRRFNDDYIVALGKFYSEDIGDRFCVTLDTGVEFTIILGDGKDPYDCDLNNMYMPYVNYDNEKCANLLEFIVDADVMKPEVYDYGSLDYLDKFKGNIVKMVYLGRDDSEDWTTYETR